MIQHGRHIHNWSFGFGIADILDIALELDKITHDLSISNTDPFKVNKELRAIYRVMNQVELSILEYCKCMKVVVRPLRCRSHHP